jgi:hypothetical protein
MTLGADDGFKRGPTHLVTSPSIYVQFRTNAEFRFFNWKQGCATAAQENYRLRPVTTTGQEVCVGFFHSKVDMRHKVEFGVKGSSFCACALGKAPPLK